MTPPYKYEGKEGLLLLVSKRRVDDAQDLDHPHSDLWMDGCVGLSRAPKDNDPNIQCSLVSCVKEDGNVQTYMECFLFFW